MSSRVSQCSVTCKLCQFIITARIRTMTEGNIFSMFTSATGVPHLGQLRGTLSFPKGWGTAILPDQGMPHPSHQGESPSFLMVVPHPSQWRYPILPNGGGVPHLGGGVFPYNHWGYHYWATPHPDLGRGHLPPSRPGMGYPPVFTWEGGTPLSRSRSQGKGVHPTETA